jgi:protein-arginine kinase activator protein McsA
MSLSAIHRRIALLEAEMAKAAAVEDFETAARLRNEIMELRG